MKRLILCFCMLGIVLNLTGCNLFNRGNNQNGGQTNSNNGGTTTAPSNPNQIDDGGTTNNNALNNQSMYKNVSEYMNALKTSGMTFINEKDITDFNFAAYEGKEFMMDNQQFYLYRVNSSNAEVKKMLDEIDKNGYVSTTQDGKEGKKYAYRMGDFVLIYPEGYDIAKIDSIFNKRT